MTKDWMEPIAARKSRRLTTHQMKDVKAHGHQLRPALPFQQRANQTHHPLRALGHGHENHCQQYDPSCRPAKGVGWFLSQRFLAHRQESDTSRHQQRRGHNA
jgi:hypothetical protein